MALPLPTDYSSLSTRRLPSKEDRRYRPCRRSAGKGSGALGLEQQTQHHNGGEPDDPGADGEAVKVALDHGGPAERRGDPAAEQVRQAAALALVEEDEQHHQRARHDEHDGSRDDHSRSVPSRVCGFAMKGYDVPPLGWGETRMSDRQFAITADLDELGRIAAQTSWASCGVATSPVPIAQTGS